MPALPMAEHVAGLEPAIAANSPHLFVDQIRTPMLVIHGDHDYRVPIGEALRLRAELQGTNDRETPLQHKLHRAWEIISGKY